MEAAKDAALSFVKQQEAGTQIGIVAFAGFAALVQTPTADQKLLEAAIENLTTARRTAIGSAILASLDAIAEIDDRVAPIPTGTAPTLESPSLPEGQFAPHIVVLLTDGVSNSGMDPVDAAQLAVERRVRVYTIGFGTETATGSMNCGNQFGEPFNRGYELGQQYGGLGFRRGIDEETLKQVANMTAAEYYSATSAGELQDVFRKLPVYLDTQEETSEISFLFAAVAAVFAVLAIALSMIWHPLG
jgi:Ca-activated chloride channel family protein